MYSFYISIFTCTLFAGFTESFEIKLIEKQGLEVQNDPVVQKPPIRLNLTLNLDGEESKLSEFILPIDLEGKVALKCSVNGKISKTSSFIWMQNGQILPNTNTLKQTIILRTDPIFWSELTIKITEAATLMFECSAESSSGQRKSAALKLIVFQNWNLSALEQSELLVCTNMPPNTCQNNGLCTYSKRTKLITCMCQKYYTGLNCEQHLDIAFEMKRLEVVESQVFWAESKILPWIIAGVCSIIALVMLIMMLISKKKPPPSNTTTDETQKPGDVEMQKFLPIKRQLLKPNVYYASTNSLPITLNRNYGKSLQSIAKKPSPQLSNRVSVTKDMNLLDSGNS